MFPQEIPKLQRLMHFLWRVSALLSVAAAIGGAQAAPVWHQSDEVYGVLDESKLSYVAAGNVATLTFVDQFVTNTAATAQHTAMYIGWNWVTGYQSGVTSLGWNNLTGLFEGQGVTMKIERLDVPAASQVLGEVIGDTWIGVPWAPAGIPAAYAIATAADWSVPLLDFGELQAGQSASYDLRVTYTFDSPARLEDFEYYHIYGQGVQQAAALPEPSTVAMITLALVALATTRRRPLRRS